jgi:phage shock protein PspC (stress-responsive transcriptional regulator)
MSPWTLLFIFGIAAGAIAVFLIAYLICARCLDDR